MKGKRFIVVFLFCLCAGVSFAQEEKQGMNNPYIDDGLFHWGFQLGVNFCSFGLDNSVAARVSAPGFGFRVGMLTELRLHRYVSLRFSPGLDFNYRTLTYKDTVQFKQSPIVSAIPIVLPLYLKWAAEREGNYRPYVIAGGGVSFNVNKYDDNNDYIGLNVLDYFCEVGAGCDFYFRWFKFCPEITYRIGFGDQLNRAHTVSGQEAYVTVLGDKRMINQAICLTFNFQD